MYSCCLRTIAVNVHSTFALHAIEFLFFFQFVFLLNKQSHINSIIINNIKLIIQLYNI